ncbi:unnamed protein product [Bursaphelenchus xylophilus]|nr:unnamed protein product [Bursaphelenchus xylophilus]CAG9105733.1 unnamed protein product [Bursaphelenchus xylophilus]
MERGMVRVPFDQLALQTLNNALFATNCYACCFQLPLLIIGFILKDSHAEWFWILNTCLQLPFSATVFFLNGLIITECALRYGKTPEDIQAQKDESLWEEIKDVIVHDLLKDLENFTDVVMTKEESLQLRPGFIGKLAMNVAFLLFFGFWFVEEICHPFSAYGFTKPHQINDQ